jgi:hypothetical protein
MHGIHFHARSWYAPLGFIQVNFSPFCFAKFARAKEYQRGEA